MEEINEQLNEEIQETIFEEPVIIRPQDMPDVYKKVVNEDGPYQDKEGNRFEIQTCKITESKEQVQVGTTTELDEEGNEIEVPIYEMQVVINKGWDSFDSLEQAVEAYGLTLYVEQEEQPETEELENAENEEIEVIDNTEEPIIEEIKE